MQNKELIVAVGEVLKSERADILSRITGIADQIKAIQESQQAPDISAADLDAMAKSFEDGINSLQEALNAKADELDDANNATLEIVGKQLEDLRGEIAKTASLARLVIEQAADATVVKQWSEGVYREGTRVSGDIGYEYQALRDTAAEPSPINPDWMVVRRGLRFCGVQSDDSIYFPGDITVKDGALWFHDGDRHRLAAMRGEKGHTGKTGEKGDPGIKGDEGPAGPAPIALEITKDYLNLVMSNGDIIDAPIAGLIELVEDAVPSMVRREMSVWDAEMDLANDGRWPLRFYRGQYDWRETYVVGDVVTSGREAYVCIKAGSSSLSQEYFKHMAGGGGSGGGGGNAATGWPNPVLIDLDMFGRSIHNLATPVATNDAATKGYVDANKGANTRQVSDSVVFLAIAGATDGARLDSLFTPNPPKNGDLVVISYNKAAADNSKAGIWRNSGGVWSQVVDLSAGIPANLDDLLDVVATAPKDGEIIVYNGTTKKWESGANTASATIKHFGANAVSAAATAGQTAEQVLLAKYTQLNGGVAAIKGVFAVIENGAGGDAKFNGVYYFDGTAWTKFAKELSTSGGVALLKALVADADPNLITTPLPAGTTQYTLELNAKEIKTVDNSGNWNTIYSETNIRNLIAQSRSFRGTVVEQGLVTVGTTQLGALPAESALTATDVGTYYVFVGTSGHVITASEIGAAASNVDATVLTPGDWLQVANLGTILAPKYGYVVIHGDTLSMARARAVFGLNLWADGAFERGSIVRYQPTPNAGIHYYINQTDVKTGDSAPGAIPPPGMSATPIAVTVTAIAAGKSYDMAITGGPVSTAAVLNVTLDVDDTPGADTQTAALTAGMTADQVADAIIAGWSNPATTATKKSPGVVHVETKLPTDSITVLTINKTTLDGINATPGVNKWVDITPYAALSSLPDCYELLKAVDGQVPTWDAANARWKPGNIGGPTVYFGNGAYNLANVTSAAGNYGMGADTQPPPQTYAPQTGDLYVDLSTGATVVFTGTPPAGRKVPSITGANPIATLDFNKSSIAKLTDVDVVTNAPADADVLTWDNALKLWVPKKVATTLGDLTDVTESAAPQAGNMLVADGTGNWAEQANPSYTKTELDVKLQTLVTGLAHDVSVIDILNNPPLNPNEGDGYIVGIAPTGVWQTHANEVAFYEAGAWLYTPAYANEAHLVEAKQAIYAWSPVPGGTGNRWVKVAGTSGTANVSSKNGVGEIIPWIADTTPADYLECRGQTIAIAAYPDLYAIIGNKYNGTAADGVSTFGLPDLRGYFLRGIGANGGEGVPGVVQDDRTRLPRAGNFTGTTSNDGAHIHGLRTGRYANFGTGGGARAVNNLDGADYEVFLGNTLSAGAHTHTVSITGGGDPETRPKSFSVRWIIRHKAIDGGAMGPKGTPGVGVPAITAADEKKIMTVTAGVAAWAAPAAALPNGTAVGQKLEWNGTIWVPAVDKVTITQASEFTTDANPAMYELKGGVWLDNNEWLHLELFGVDGTTRLVPDATWFLSGSAWMQVSTYASLTDSSTDSDTHGGRGFNQLPSGIIELGKNWVDHNKGWVDIDLNMVATVRNGRSDNAPIAIKYSYHNDQDHQVTGVFRISAPRGTVVGKVKVSSGATTTYSNCVVRKTLL